MDSNDVERSEDGHAVRFTEVMPRTAEKYSWPSTSERIQHWQLFESISKPTLKAEFVRIPYASRSLTPSATGYKMTSGIPRRTRRYSQNLHRVDLERQL